MITWVVAAVVIVAIVITIEIDCVILLSFWCVGCRGVHTGALCGGDLLICKSGHVDTA